MFHNQLSGTSKRQLQHITACDQAILFGPAWTSHEHQTHSKSGMGLSVAWACGGLSIRKRSEWLSKAVSCSLGESECKGYREYEQQTPGSKAKKEARGARKWCELWASCWEWEVTEQGQAQKLKDTPGDAWCRGRNRSWAELLQGQTLLWAHGL